MHKLIFLALTLLAGYGLISCGSVSRENAFDKNWSKSFVDSINSKFSEEITNGDSTALASHYWPDAELLLDNSEVVKGKDIVNAWGEAIRMGVKGMTFSTTDVTGTSTFIIETGNYVMTDSAQTLLDRGKYVVVWEKRNGEWKLYRDIGSTSLPLSK